MNGYAIIPEPLMIIVLVIGGILIGHLFHALGELRSFLLGIGSRVTRLEQKLHRMTQASSQAEDQRLREQADVRDPQVKLPRHLTEEPAVPPPPIVPDIPPPPDVWDSKTWSQKSRPMSILCVHVTAGNNAGET